MPMSRLTSRARSEAIRSHRKHSHLRDEHEEPEQRGAPKRRGGGDGLDLVLSDGRPERQPERRDDGPALRAGGPGDTRRSVEITESGEIGGGQGDQRRSGESCAPSPSRRRPTRRSSARRPSCSSGCNETAS